MIFKEQEKIMSVNKTCEKAISVEDNSLQERESPEPYLIESLALQIYTKGGGLY